MNVGLVSHDAVQWLITAEPDVKKQIERFILGQAEPYLDVAGPPSASDAIKYHKNPGGPVTLPCVRLNLSMTTHHLTGQKAVAVTCSDLDMREIANWRFAASVRKRH